MSEKQFEIKADDVDSSIINITRDGEDFAWFLSDIVTDKQVEKVVDKLNEQQATISKQLDKIIELQDKYRILEFNHSRLEKRNKAQYEKIDEQQTIINKLKEENKELKQQLNKIPKNIREVWK